MTLDLGSLVAQIGGRLGIGANLASKIPADAGQITILKSDQLSAAESVAQLIRRLPIVLTLLVLVLYGLAVYLARGRRRKTLRSVGFALMQHAGMSPNRLTNAWVPFLVTSALLLAPNGRLARRCGRDASA